MAERASTILEAVEEIQYKIIGESENPSEVRDALAELGSVHVAMGSTQEVHQGLRETWASMHGRSGTENLGTVAHVAAQLLGGHNNPLTREHQAAVEKDQESTK